MSAGGISNNRNLIFLPKIIPFCSARKQRAVSASSPAGSPFLIQQGSSDAGFPGAPSGPGSPQVTWSSLRPPEDILSPGGSLTSMFPTQALGDKGTLLSPVWATGSCSLQLPWHLSRTYAISYKENIVGKTILNRKNLIFLQQAFPP